MNQIMSLYKAINEKSGATDDAGMLRDFVLANQLGYADRDHYVAGPAAVTVPAADLLNPAYVKSRAEGGFKPGDVPAPGDPGKVLHNKPIIDMWGRDANSAPGGTSHFSIVDAEGNAVSA